MERSGKLAGFDGVLYFEKRQLGVDEESTVAETSTNSLERENRDLEIVSLKDEIGIRSD